MTKKRIFSVVIAIAMIMSMAAFTGCGSKKAEEAPKPTNTQELLDANKKANEKAETFSFKGEGDAEIKAGSQGMEMSITANFSGDGEASKDVIHVKAKASMDMLGEKQDVAPEIYVDKKNNKVVARTEEDGKWTSSDLDMDTEEIKFEMPESLKKQLEFKETDDAYVLECDLSKVDIKELLKSVAEEQGDVEGLDDMLAAIEKVDAAIDSGTFTMEFDKDTCLQKSIIIKDLSGSGSSEIAEGQNMEMTVAANLKFTFSDYDKVSDDKFEVPSVE